MAGLIWGQALHLLDEGIGLERRLGEVSSPSSRGQLGFVLLIAPQHIDGAHLCHIHLGPMGS
jgi:hypothetical protein